ncbi:PTS system beta-glucoside-specific transporter subunits IIABC [compost metagenome]
MKAGETLIQFDIAAIERAGYDLITPIVVVNGEEDATLRITPAASVTFGEELMVQSTRGSAA